MTDTLSPTVSQQHLAAFLQTVMNTPPPDPTLETGTSPLEPDVLRGVEQDYHLEFSQQIPDLVLAILTDGPDTPQHVTRFGALLFHLVGCDLCHQVYMELYDSLRSALSQPANQETAEQQTLSPSAGDRFCRALIAQAEAVLIQTTQENREDHLRAARQLLQTAIRTGGSIKQAWVRQRALSDLVRVALLADPQEGEASAPLSYALVTQRGIVRRRLDSASAEVNKQNAIVVRCGPLRGGEITQHEQVLTLHLADLDAEMCGRRIKVSFPLGTIFEPIHWYGSPRALFAPTLVSENGTVQVPLGETELQISVSAEKSLLEVLFLLLEIRVVDNGA